MTSAINTAAAGLRARQTQLDATARNIANADTRGYKRLEVRQEETAAGVQARVERVGAPGVPQPARPGEAGPLEGSNVDLAREIPDLIVSGRGYEANLQVLRTADEMLGELLDTKG